MCYSPWGHKESDTTDWTEYILWVAATSLIFLVFYNHTEYLKVTANICYSCCIPKVLIHEQHLHLEMEGSADRTSSPIFWQWNGGTRWHMKVTISSPPSPLPSYLLLLLPPSPFSSPANLFFETLTTLLCILYGYFQSTLAEFNSCDSDCLIHETYFLS